MSVFCGGQQFFVRKRPEVPAEGNGGEGKVSGKFFSGGGGMFIEYLQNFARSSLIFPELPQFSSP